MSSVVPAQQPCFPNDRHCAASTAGLVVSDTTKLGLEQTTTETSFPGATTSINEHPEPSIRQTEPEPSRAASTSQIAQSSNVLVANPTDVSTPTSLASSSSNGSGGLKPGAVAGVAIGALIIGAAAAFLVAFFLFKKRNNKRGSNVNANGYTNYADSTPELVMMPQKSVGLGGRNSPYVQVSQTPISAPIPAPVPAPVPVQQSRSSDVASLLPPPAQENAIHSKVSALFSQIHRHIDTYYRDVHASITPSMEPELERFGVGDVNMAELLQDCSSPTTALKHALTAYVLGITGPKQENDGETLFPAQLSGAQIAHGEVISSDPNLAAATTLHRRLSVYLYSATSSPSNSRRSWSFQSDIREAAEHFLLTFFPWANPTSSDQDKEEDLTRIISDALEARIWLYGQSFLYNFEWEGTGRRGVLVSPSLVRRTDNERGETAGRVVVEGVVVSI